MAGDRAELTGATNTVGSSTATIEWAVDVVERRQSCVVHVQGERARLRAQVSGGRWASGAQALKGRGCGEVVEERTDVGASTAGTRAGG